MTDKEIRHIGYQFGLGLLKVLALVIVVAFIIQMMFNAVGFRTDATDLDGWNRSGMRLHTDHETGIEYLSAPGGGIIVRENPDTP